MRLYKRVSKSFWIGRLEREMQMVQLSATRYSCIAILWVSLVSFTIITICVGSQRVFIVVNIYFVIDSVRNLLDKPSYTVCGCKAPCTLDFCTVLRWAISFYLRPLYHQSKSSPYCLNRSLDKLKSLSGYDDEIKVPCPCKALNRWSVPSQ
jgi:hypothetical protein